MFALDAALPHAWAYDPCRQLEIAECRHDVGGRHERSSHVCNLPRALAHESLWGSDGHDLLPIFLDVLPSWSFEPFFRSWTSLFLQWISLGTCSSASRSPLPPSRLQRRLSHTSTELLQCLVGPDDSVLQTLAHPRHHQLGNEMLVLGPPACPIW